MSQVFRDYGLLRNIVRGASIAFGLQVTGAGLAYLLQVWLARLLGSTDYGIYAYVIAWVSILAIPAGLGFGPALVRFLPEYLTNREWARLKGIIQRSRQLTLIASSVLAVVAGLFVYSVDTFLVTVPHATVLVAGFWLIPVRTLVELHVQLGRGLGHMVNAYAPTQVVRPLLIATGLYLVLSFASGATAIDAIWVTFGASAVVVAFQVLLLHGNIPEQVHGAEPDYETRNWMSVSLPLLLLSGFLLIIDRTDVIMLGILSESTDVGLYNAAARTAALGSFVLTGVNAIAAPTISKLYHSEKREQLQQFASQVAHLMFWPSLIICGTLVVAAEPILSLFGSEFIGARSVLVVLVVAHIVNVGVGSVGYFMSMTGHEREMAGVVGAVAVGNVVLNGLAIPLFGRLGAAGATATSMIIWNIVLYRRVCKLLGIRLSIINAVASGWREFELR